MIVQSIYGGTGFSPWRVLRRDHPARLGDSISPRRRMVSDPSRTYLRERTRDTLDGARCDYLRTRKCGTRVRRPETRLAVDHRYDNIIIREADDFVKSVG